MQRHRLAVGPGVNAVGVQATGHGFAAFFKGFGQRALKDAQPVAVAQHLVVGINGGHRVFQVQNGGQGCLHHHVGHAGRIGLANGGGAVDENVNVQAVVHQQHAGGGGRIALVADKLGGILQTSGAAVLQRHHQLAAFHAVAAGIPVRALGQGHGLVQKVAGKGHHLGTAQRVVARAFLRPVLVADHIGAVQRVVQRTPAGIGRVQGVAGIHDGHHQLRAGHAGQLGIHVFGRGLHALGGLNHVANLGQKLLVSRHVGNRAGVGLVPGVQLFLQALALGQQGGVFRCQIAHQGIKPLPESGRVQAGARQHLGVDKLVQNVSHLQAVRRNTSSHGNPLSKKPKIREGDPGQRSTGQRQGRGRALHSALY